MRLTALAHTIAGERLAPGDLAVDATAGNGHDTKFLAEKCGDTGHVWAFDIQESALLSTRKRLERHALTSRVSLRHASNADMRTELPPHTHGNLAVIIANLGYLPGGDPTVITAATSTLAMLDAALALLKPGGTLLVTAYPGHEGGDSEAAAVHSRLRLFETQGHTLRIHGEPLSEARRPWLADLVKHPDARP